MTESISLTREEAIILLDDFRDLLLKLEAREGSQDLAQDANRLAERLDRLPLPENVLSQNVQQIRSWTEALLEGRGGREQVGVGSIPTQLESRVHRLRMMLDAGVAP